MALGAAPIPVDIVKESADGFGPLKAVLGAIAAIHTNHEVRT